MRCHLPPLPNPPPHVPLPSPLVFVWQRFARNCIYTYSGRILLSVNPFKDLPLYTPEVLRTYLHAGEAQPGVPYAYEGLPPHVFAMADWAYRRMLQSWKGMTTSGGCCCCCRDCCCRL